MSRALVAALAKLLDGKDQTQTITCSASTFTHLQRQALENLGRQTGALRVKPEGRGNVYEVVNVALLLSHLRDLRPQHADEIDTSIPNRAVNIAASRNSKSQSHGHELHYLLVKSISNDVVWVNNQDAAEQIFDLSATTNIAGASVLAIREDDAWRSEQPLWLVENQALFDRLDWLPAGSQGTVAYYAGQLPGRLLSWLAYRSRTPEIILFPDYDGVGLLNYARLLERSSSPCSFWLMPEWQMLLQKYGNNLVWQNTLSDFQAAFPRLKAAGASADVIELCLTLSRQGLALEHESVWLSASDK